MDKLPVSIVVPLTTSRREFFETECLPSIIQNSPDEVIVIDDPGKAPYKRNLGLSKISGKNRYVLFSDDDIIYPDDWLSRMIKTIEHDNSVMFSYTGYIAQGHGKLAGSKDWNFNFNAPEFNLNRLKKGNYISTMSLIKSEYVIPWDEDSIMCRFQDWEYFLRMCLKFNKGGKMLHYPFIANYFEDSLHRNWPKNVNTIIKEYIHKKLLIDKDYG
jgi:hypothetical protein